MLLRCIFFSFMKQEKDVFSCLCQPYLSLNPLLACSFFPAFLFEGLYLTSDAPSCFEHICDSYIFHFSTIFFFLTLCITFSICLIPHLSWLTAGLFLTPWHCSSLILRFELLCSWVVWLWFCPQLWNYKTKTYSLCKVSVATENADIKKLGAFKVWDNS